VSYDTPKVLAAPRDTIEDTHSSLESQFNQTQQRSRGCAATASNRIFHNFVLASQDFDKIRGEFAWNITGEPTEITFNHALSRRFFLIRVILVVHIQGMNYLIECSDIFRQDFNLLITHHTEYQVVNRGCPRFHTLYLNWIGTQNRTKVTPLVSIMFRLRNNLLSGKINATNLENRKWQGPHLFIGGNLPSSLKEIWPIFLGFKRFE
jgi:hypothetical protein